MSTPTLLFSNPELPPKGSSNVAFLVVQGVITMCIMSIQTPASEFALLLQAEAGYLRYDNTEA
jgi:hypothetical protein